jgi:uncharacterized membrane protein
MTDDRMELLIGGLLRAGVMIAAGVTLAGGIWYFATSGDTLMAYRVFRGEPAELRSVAGVIQGIRDGHPEALIQLGLLLLVATPVARVALSTFAFALEHDRLYVWITILVFVLLIGSITGFFAR